MGLGDRLDDLLLRLEAWAVARKPMVAAIAVLSVAAAVTAAVMAGGDEAPVENAIPLATAGPTGSDPQPVSSLVPPAAEEPAAAPSSDPAGRTTAEPADLVVHVIGAVRRPGLVTVEAGARVDEAVRAAGGPTAEADIDRLNLASPVVDGMQIRVPTVDDAADPGAAAVDDPLIRWPQATAPPTGSTEAAGPGGGPPAQPVDLNRATEAQLEGLPGIGPALAAAIVRWRVEHGPFATVDELEAVPGIGPAKLAALRDRAIVR